MYTVISPAKKLNFDKLDRKIQLTKPNFKPDTDKVIKKVKQFSSKDLQKLMKISSSLADLNYERFKTFGKFNLANEKKCFLNILSPL